jgi:AraC-like DNA-binding protein
MSLLAIDMAIRGAGIALSLFLAVRLFSERAASAGLFGSLFTISVAGYFVCSAPEFGPHLGLIAWPAMIVCFVSPALFWLFARALFDDEFFVGPFEALAPAGLIAASTVSLLAESVFVGQTLSILIRLFVIGLVIHAIWTAWGGRSADLVEARRTFRAAFLIASGIYVGGISIAELFLGSTEAPLTVVILNAAGITVLLFANALYFTRLQTDLIAAPAPVASIAAPTAPAGEALHGDDGLLQKLRAAMETDRLYRLDGLAIGQLAERLGAQEYVLRRLINQQLGHRNFNAFLNGYRLGDVKGALKDPSQAEVSILTIALDAGFSSLGPFNRAFKADTGVTPSEYRRQDSA